MFTFFPMFNFLPYVQFLSLCSISFSMLTYFPCAYLYSPCFLSLCSHSCLFHFLSQSSLSFPMLTFIPNVHLLSLFALFTNFPHMFTFFPYCNFFSYCNFFPNVHFLSLCLSLFPYVHFLSLRSLSFPMFSIFPYVHFNFPTSMHNSRSSWKSRLIISALLFCVIHNFGA